jgi:hypothetical protein
MKLKDSSSLEPTSSDGEISGLPRVIRVLADSGAENTGAALEAMIWLHHCNSEFESEIGRTIDQACFDLIDQGNYQPVLRHILAVGELSSRLPADSQATRLLNAYIGKYLDAMDAKDNSLA